jgi:hypothetical protein
MQKHAFLTLVALLLAALAVAWLRPNDNGGIAFVVVVSVLLTNAIGLAIWPRHKQKNKPRRSVVTSTPASRLKRKATPK